MEQWKDIKGFEGYYQVSNLGRIKSFPRLVPGGNNVRSFPERILTNSIQKNGYLRVNLKADNLKLAAYVHRLVAAAFLQMPANDSVVNHKDGNKQNNHVDNLEWCSQRDNLMHAFATGLNKVVTVAWKEKHGDALQGNCRKVEQLTITGDYISAYDSISIAAKSTGLNRPNINAAISGRRTHCGGFKWRYAQ